MTLPELSVAAFGASGAGKTVLLSAFFRAQTQTEFEKDHAYKIQAVDRGKGSELLGRFYDLEAGQFPEGSTRFDDYAFDFYARGIGEAAFRIHWYDYPGRWWEDEPQDPEEQAAMRRALSKLRQSGVGLLLADGAKFKAEGVGYARWLFEHFANECERLKRHSQQLGEPATFPREWIVALTKADLYPADYTAQSFEREVLRGSREQLRHLSDVVGTDGAFGSRFMLLSSVRIAGEAAIDPTTTIGLSTLGPAVLMTTVEGAAREAQTKAKDKSLGESVLEGVRGLVRLIDGLDNFLPDKYQLITKILQVLPVEEIASRKLEKLKSAREAAVRKGDAFRAVVNGMAAALVSDEGQRAYFRNQS